MIQEDILAKILGKCLLHLRVGCSNRLFPLIQLELEHLTYLLELAQGHSTVETYINKSNDLFYITKNNKINGCMICDDKDREDLSKHKKFLFHLSEKDKIYIDILIVFCHHAHRERLNNNTDNIWKEVYYNHNVPGLIGSKDKGSLKYYLGLECKEFKNYLNPEDTKEYEIHWKKLKKVLRKRLFRLKL